MKIFKKYTFDSAHFLPNVSETHKCKRMHGHTYHLTVFIEGEIDEKYGWIIDFNDLKSVVNPVIEQLDHHVLNEIEGLENPTCEILAKWLYDKIKPDVPLLESIEIYETPTSGAIYSR
tara:strand:- start:4669 stop:5022 length:354 start_codon:yes stop_codon:yes gene_type:complete